MVYFSIVMLVFGCIILVATIISRTASWLKCIPICLSARVDYHPYHPTYKVAASYTCSVEISAEEKNLISGIHVPPCGNSLVPPKQNVVWAHRTSNHLSGGTTGKWCKGCLVSKWGKKSKNDQIKTLYCSGTKTLLSFFLSSFLLRFRVAFSVANLFVNKQPTHCWCFTPGTWKLAPKARGDLSGNSTISRRIHIQQIDCL